MNNTTQRRRRVRKNRNQNKAKISRILLTVCMMALVAVVSIGGTLAWLTDSTSEIKNTFEASGVDIAIYESKCTIDQDGNATYEDAAENVSNTYKMIPGKEYKKDPTVKVLDATSVPVYLFVKFEEANNASTYLTYTSLLVDTGAEDSWKKLTGVDGVNNVWYRTVKPSDGVKEWHLLMDDKITVNGNINKSDMTDAAKAALNYTAYAVQVEGSSDATAAWAKIGN